MSISTDVTVLGLGPMGAALANSLIERGFSVTVWNRTPGRETQLVEKGAIAARTAADAVASSPVILTSLLNYATTEQVFASTGQSSLAGKTVVNIATGTPSESATFLEFCSSRGADYVDAKLMFYPRQVGATDSVAYVAARQEVYDRTHALLIALAGTPDYLGDNFKSPSALYLAIWVYYYCGFFGFIEASAFVQRSGLTISQFLVHVKRATGDMVEHMEELTERVSNGNYAGDQAKLETYVDGFAKMDQAFVDSGLKPELLQGVRTLTDRAIAKGLDAEDVAAVLKSISGAA